MKAIDIPVPMGYRKTQLTRIPPLHTVMAVYELLLVIKCYKWSYTLYKWGFVSTYNW